MNEKPENHRTSISDIYVKDVTLPKADLVEYELELVAGGQCAATVTCVKDGGCTTSTCDREK